MRKESYPVYRLEEILPDIDNLSEAFKILLSEQEIKPEQIYDGSTRYAYDSSDFTSWTLLFGANREIIQVAKEKLLSYTYKNKPVFNISGNGWGTGISVMLNLSSEFD